MILDIVHRHVLVREAVMFRKLALLLTPAKIMKLTHFSQLDGENLCLLS
jgi:hypothetical protein